ncbi:MAG TPA: protein translocase subunit SecD [Longimicrobiaceae bacterium]|nr:protein translocase subunit SecD [Longimicrobiaceae bacterium]
MFDNLKIRFLFILALVLASGWFLYQNHSARGSIVTLGLDLQGGTHLALEVEDQAGAMTPEARADATDRALQVIRTRIDELGVAEPVVQKVGEDRIIVELPGARPEDQRRAKEIIQRSAFLQFKIVRPLGELQSALARMDRAVTEAAGTGAVVGPDAPAAPAPGVTDLFQPVPRDTAAGDTAAVADTAGDTTAVAAAQTSPQDTALAARPLSSLLLPTGAEGQFAVEEENVERVQQYLALPEVQRLLPRGTELRWGFQPRGEQAQPYRILYLLETRPIITGEYLQDAQAQRDPQFGRPEVTFEFNRRGGRIFERATGENVGNLMAIILDERVYSAPIIQSQIGSRGRIELGGASMEEARDLALVLRAGALPAPLGIIEERTVGPSLGQDSIDKGRIAGLIGITLVVLVMLLYYRVSGAMAVVALGFYVLLVLGGLASIDAALTLPGIAGLVLSIGMAVDANVLIFERIREELAVGRSPRGAVSEGFANALSAIVDSNLTTLITAFILYQFGTGPIRGFAVVLAIGIIASMFTAIFVTRTFFMLYLERRSAREAISI